MSIDHALWVHGHSAEIEYPDRVDSIVQKGYYVRVQGNPSTSNWLHFAVPTAVIVDDYRMRPRSIQFRYKTDGGGSVDAVHVYDGETRIATDNSPTKEIDPDGWTRIQVGFDPSEVPAVYFGIGISILLRFDRHGGWLEFESAGCDFEYPNRLGSQRLLISTNKRRVLEFPYRSSLPIDVPNGAIERILISLHGTGAGADFYLSNGLAATKAAADAGVDGRALNNTLVIAPQFIKANEYYLEFAANILHWNGGRASSKESVRRDLDGDGVPDSGTLSSFTVMDTLLERVCRRRLFPNLMSIVVAGQSNGGRFISRYAAVSRFEQEVATPRGIHVRYVVMGSGSYLYIDDSRLAFDGETYPDHSSNWRDMIVDLEDFSTVCDELAGEYNDWPNGLSDLWPYPAQAGKTLIQNQFVSRDVHYMVGEKDDSESYKECPERVQGQDTLTKTLLYYRHLEQFCAERELDLRHQLHVVPGVGHSGRDIMTSSIGLAALFGPIT